MARSYDNSGRRAKAEHTRDRILAAAADVIAEGGSLDVSLPAVAAMADVSQPTLFRHFPSKQALFAALAELQFRTLTSGVAPTTVEELHWQLPTVFTRAAEMEPLVRWTLAGGRPASREPARNGWRCSEPQSGPARRTPKPS